jgi:hypothetical protein
MIIQGDEHQPGIRGQDPDPVIIEGQNIFQPWPVCVQQALNIFPDCFLLRHDKVLQLFLPALGQKILQICRKSRHGGTEH